MYLQRQQDLVVALVGQRLLVQSGTESLQGLGQCLCIQLELDWTNNRFLTTSSGELVDLAEGM